MAKGIEDKAPKPDPAAPFNYVVGLHLLFIAFGFGKVLDGTGLILEHRNWQEFCVAHALTCLLVGLQLLQNAWASFQNYAVREWTLQKFVLVCSTPLFYLVIADLLFPKGAEATGDFAKVYTENVRIMAALAIAGQITSTLAVHQVAKPSPERRAQDWIRLIAVGLLTLLLLPYPQWKPVHVGSLAVLCLALAEYVRRSKTTLNLGLNG